MAGRATLPHSAAKGLSGLGERRRVLWKRAAEAHFGAIGAKMEVLITHGRASGDRQGIRSN
jgi:hypothetical protein